VRIVRASSVLAAFVTLSISLSAEAQVPPPPPAAPDPTPDLPPEGTAGDRATAAGSTGIAVRPGVELFAQYGLRLTRTLADETEWFHVFELPRAHLSVDATYEPVAGRAVIEAVRSASEGALTGVAGDSLVMRVREAWGSWHHGQWISVAGGVVPTLTIPELDGTWRLRAVSPAPLEATGLASPADLGVSARTKLPRDYGWAGVGWYNGEGYNGRELNRGKTLELAASAHPVPDGVMRPFAVFASYLIGSTGTGSARADRLTGALLWQGRRIRGGFAATYAWGVRDQGAQRSVLGDVFVSAEPIDRLLLGVRGGIWWRNTDVSGDRITTVTGTAGFRVARPLEVFLATTRNVPEEVAHAALPGSSTWDFRLVTHVLF
jgi:hypothetical protein